MRMVSKFPPTMIILVEFLQCKVDDIKIETISGTLTQRRGFVGLSMTSKTEKLNTGARSELADFPVMMLVAPMMMMLMAMMMVTRTTKFN